jgi:Domain of unknown function (DUF4304)
MARLEDSIRRFLAPPFREDGFRGSGRNFRRVREDFVHAINVQGSRHGGQFAINLGVQPLSLPDVLGNPVDPEKLVESLCEFRRRLCEQGVDQWWKYGATQSSMDSACQEAAEIYTRLGRPLFEHASRPDCPFHTLTASDFDAGTFDLLGFHSTKARMAWVLARLRLSQGNLSAARAFASVGLASVGDRAAWLRRELESLNERL